MREIGPSDITYKTGDFVRILTDCRYGWQHGENNNITGYDKRVKYYQGEIIRLKEDEWRNLGTMQIKPVNPAEFAAHVPSRFRIFACGVKRRFGYWGRDSLTKVGCFLYACVEIPCTIIAVTCEAVFSFLGLQKIAALSGILVLLVLLGILWFIV